MIESRINFIFIINTFLRFSHSSFLVWATFLIINIPDMLFLALTDTSPVPSCCLIIVVIYYSETICYADFLQKYNLWYFFSRSPPSLPEVHTEKHACMLAFIEFQPHKAHAIAPPHDTEGNARVHRDWQYFDSNYVWAWVCVCTICAWNAILKDHETILVCVLDFLPCVELYLPSPGLNGHWRSLFWRCNIIEANEGKREESNKTHGKN